MTTFVWMKVAFNGAKAIALLLYIVVPSHHQVVGVNKVIVAQAREVPHGGLY